MIGVTSGLEGMPNTPRPSPGPAWLGAAPSPRPAAAAGAPASAPVFGGASRTDQARVSLVTFSVLICARGEYLAPEGSRAYIGQSPSRKGPLLSAIRTRPEQGGVPCAIGKF